MALASLFVSALAIFLSAGTALRQIWVARSATHTMLSVEILKQYLDGGFAESERLVHDQLDSNAPSSFSDLPVDTRSHAYKVAMMYQMIGYLAAVRAVDRRFVQYLFGINVVRSWNALKPLIEAQREIDPVGVGFRFFEDLAARNATVNSSEVIRRFKLRKLH